VVVAIGQMVVEVVGSGVGGVIITAGPTQAVAITHHSRGSCQIAPAPKSQARGTFLVITAKMMAK